MAALVKYMGQTFDDMEENANIQDGSDKLFSIAVENLKKITYCINSFNLYVTSRHMQKT